MPTEIVPPTVNPMVVTQAVANAEKPGIKTTEFYVPSMIAVIVGVILPVVNKRYNLELQQTDITTAAITVIAAVGSIISSIAYVIGRAKVKSAALSSELI